MNFEIKLGKNKGITLIALVVTIIVLLILAGISITMLTGQNGILNRAGEAKTTNGVAQSEELLKVSVMDALTKGLGDLKDTDLRKALSSNLGTEGKDYEIIGDEYNGWTITIDETEKDYQISTKGEIKEIEKVEGNSSDWKVEGNAVVKYLGNDTNIVIPNYVNGTKITEVGDSIFENSEIEGTLKISEGIKVIGSEAFSRSKFTGTLTLPNTLKTIKQYAFAGSTGFTGDLIIPSSVEMGTGAFRSCTGFNGNLIFQNGRKKIDEDVFIGCTGFTGDLVIPDSVEEIGGGAFVDCTGFNGKLVFPSNLKKIGNSAFYGCSSFTGDLIIPESAKIEIQAFSYLQTEGTLYMGKNMENAGWNTPVNAKKLIINTPMKEFALMQFFTKIESCWLSSDTIKDLEKNEMFSIEDCIKNKNMVMYTEATKDNPNWPENWNPFDLKVVYNTSLEDYKKIQ